MPITVVDLFCGIGGLTHGLLLAGLNVVAGIDIDASCRFPYEENNDAVFIEGDVAQITSDTISRHYNEGDICVLVGWSVFVILVKAELGENGIQNCS